MCCVIQEIELKKPNKHGEHKELKADSYTFTINGVTSTKHKYSYGEERFERPIKKAFKISIHESKRVNGVVTKRQYVVTTVEYYWLATGWFGLSDYDNKIISIAKKLEVDNTDEIYNIIYAKLNALEEEIKKEYQKTEEYKTHRKHRKIIDRYGKAKSKFAKTYDCNADEYDYCYNVFGELMNKEYFDKIVNSYNAKRSYQEQSYSNYNSYDWRNYKNDYSGYLDSSSDSYTDNEKAMLKKFYRTLSKAFHPDNIQGSGEEMQLINNLKKTWGI